MDIISGGPATRATRAVALVVAQEKEAQSTGYSLFWPRKRSQIHRAELLPLVWPESS